MGLRQSFCSKKSTFWLYIMRPQKKKETHTTYTITYKMGSQWWHATADPLEYLLGAHSFPRVALCMLFWLCMLFPLSNCGHGKWPGLLDSYFFYEQLYSFFSSTEATIEKPRLHNKFTNRNPPWGISPSHSKVTHMEVGKATVSAVGVFVGTKISWGSRLP